MTSVRRFGAGALAFASLALAAPLAAGPLTANAGAFAGEGTLDGGESKGTWQASGTLARGEIEGTLSELPSERTVTDEGESAPVAGDELAARRAARQTG